MVMRFDEEGNVFARALQVWLILVGNATRREIPNYGYIAGLIGTPPPAIGGFLNPIEHFCQQNELPDLAVLVVNQATGQPGPGFLGDQNTIDAERERVYQYDWLAVFPPTMEQLEMAVGEA